MTIEMSQRSCWLRSCLLLVIMTASCLSSFTSCTIYKRGCTVRVVPETCALTCCGRRPPVMVHYPEVIVDFDPCGHAPDANKGKVPPEYLEKLQLRKEPYRINKGDVLEVSIFTNDENGLGEVVVAPDGYIYFMYLDGIKAEGRTPEELAADIEKGLGVMLTSPNVAVVPKVKAADYFMVLGKVMRPGVYPLNTAVDLRSAIGEAGGLNDGGYRGSTMHIANLTKSFVARKGVLLNVDFEGLIQRGDDSQNIYLKPGDYVYIASALDEEVYLIGVVGGRVVPFRDDLTLISALSPVYGPRSWDPYINGNWREILILRGSLDCPCVIRANFMAILTGEAKDVYLQAGDIVYIPAQELRFGKALVKLAIESFVSAFMGSAALYHVNKIVN